VRGKQLWGVWTFVREDEPARSSVATVPIYVVILRCCEDSILLLIKDHIPPRRCAFKRTALGYFAAASASRYPDPLEKKVLSEDLKKS
jgi:hypothetical protein